MQYHVDGHLVDADDAALPLDDRAVTLGDAVTDTVRVYEGTPFAWETHVGRLFDACTALGFDPGVGAAALRERIETTLAANDLADALVRVSITRGRGDDVDPAAALPDAARLRPPNDPDPSVVVVADPAPESDAPPTLQTVHVRAIPPDAVPAAPLTHCRLDAVCAQAALRRAAPPDGDPADEALLLDADGHLVSGTVCDLGFVDGEAVRLPALGDRMARTATRSVVRELARDEGLPVADGAYTPADVRGAEEAFVVGPSVGIRPLARLDGVPVGGGPVTDLLSRRFADRVASTCGRGREL
ncbi:aminotransferase class IV [Haloplanus pelagicus]|jgi:branched-chain amino acid aminotransferase|uniref:aminotransferase class IV n=1 Tax=Haloplanus pelagicus TaxID=2949995 RepID=UPI00203FB3A8|nr:aminotransferase class IV [Haloplanus sp. HW8-1]